MTEIRRTDVGRGNFSCSTPKLCGKGGRKGGATVKKRVSNAAHSIPLKP